MWPRGGLPYPRVLEGRPAGLVYVRPPTDMIFSGAVSRIGVGIRLTPPQFSGEGGRGGFPSFAPEKWPASPLLESFLTKNTAPTIRKNAIT